MRSFLILALFLLSSNASVKAFAPLTSSNQRVVAVSLSKASPTSLSSATNNNQWEHQDLASVARSTAAAVVTGTTAMMTMMPSEVLAVADEVEIAELPPPYVPVLFGVGLLVGVGLLTGSLGDVLDEEASLGLQSGARAKKEMERSRSSYFKK